MNSVTDEPVRTEVPCPSWCAKHWPTGPGLQHQSLGVRFSTGFVSLERHDTATTEGVTSLVIERADDGETIVIAASDADSLVAAINAVRAEADR